MTFRPDSVEEFLSIFAASKSKIRHFEGCNHLELWRDADHPNVFTTYSHWASAEALENYRYSDLFIEVWAATRVLFEEKAVAWSNTIFTRAE